VDKYSWVDIGSSFLPSDIIAAYLYAQLENLEAIQTKRKEIWQTYYNGLKSLVDKEFIKFPVIPSFASNNAHMFYIICKNEQQRNQLLQHLKMNNIGAVFHYISLHQSSYYLAQNSNKAELPNSDFYTDTLVRLPFYYELDKNELEFVIDKITQFFEANK
jgi:dTDP-4-amino-4,6-dideoxygalactose transaminase